MKEKTLGRLNESRSLIVSRGKNKPTKAIVPKMSYFGGKNWLNLLVILSPVHFTNFSCDPLLF